MCDARLTVFRVSPFLSSFLALSRARVVHLLRRLFLLSSVRENNPGISPPTQRESLRVPKGRLVACAFVISRIFGRRFKASRVHMYVSTAGGVLLSLGVASVTYIYIYICKIEKYPLSCTMIFLSGDLEVRPRKRLDALSIVSG